MFLGWIGALLCLGMLYMSAEARKGKAVDLVGRYQVFTIASLVLFLLIAIAG